MAETSGGAKKRPEKIKEAEEQPEPRDPYRVEDAHPDKG